MQVEHIEREQVLQATGREEKESRLAEARQMVHSIG